ncbi:chorismate synthase [Campylobacterota bacterium]|nr:chorismate synthase [Campylobacterota bacterium]
MNSFGSRFRVTTFGESHGAGVGCVIDGVPAGVAIDTQFLQSELDRRRPGANAYGTKRNEPDTAEIVSGVFEGFSTGAPIAIFIRNTSQKSGDYDALRDLFRPAHADFSWFAKYGIRDHRGGGRTSARETAARVAAGAIAKLLLAEIGAKVEGGIYAIGDVSCETTDFLAAKTSPIYALDRLAEAALIEEIEAARRDQDSVGAVVKARAIGVPAGLGEPLYDKLDAKLAEALMGINAVKSVAIGLENAPKLRGSENNDQMSAAGFLSNNAGGILGGVSTGEAVELTIGFKPTPSIFKPQRTVDLRGQEQICEIKGRHDPCVGVRGVVVCEAMIALVLADMAIANLGSRVENLRKIYG